MTVHNFNVLFYNTTANSILFDVQWLIDFNDDQVNLDVVPWFPWFARIHIVLKTIGNLTKKLNS